MKLTSFEICAGAGGQALGLELAGFRHVGLVEHDRHCCTTLSANRPRWNVIQADVRLFDASEYRGVDLFAGGVPCPPFSVAGKQLGSDDERDLFPAALELISQIRPKAVLLENVRGFLDPRFDHYRNRISASVRDMGYATGWRLLNACDFGVPQLRPRVIFIAINQEFSDRFEWPLKVAGAQPSVGATLYDLMAASGWSEVEEWVKRANGIAPTIVGGSKKHGGPDLGPTRARQAWATMGVDGLGLANDPPGSDFSGLPRLTLRMVARLQGFPDSWQFTGGKTAAYRQVGNAFPPPVAYAIGQQIFKCLTGRTRKTASAWNQTAVPTQETLFALNSC